MPMDAYRDGNQLIVQFDLPSIDPDSIELNVENNVLTVKTSRPRPQIDKSQ
ncbi:MAG: Hsp20 family protein [Pseudonocardiaceae bacterium]